MTVGGYKGDPCTLGARSRCVLSGVLAAAILRVRRGTINQLNSISFHTNKQQTTAEELDTATFV